MPRIGAALRCRSMRVAARTLYENADPYLFKEASGGRALQHVVFEAETESSVRVSGATFHPASAYNVKLEGAELAGYSTVMIGGIRDPFLIRPLQLRPWEMTGDFEHSPPVLPGPQPGPYPVSPHTH